MERKKGTNTEGECLHQTDPCFKVGPTPRAPGRWAHRLASLSPKRMQGIGKESAVLFPISKGRFVTW